MAEYLERVNPEHFGQRGGRSATLFWQATIRRQVAELRRECRALEKVTRALERVANMRRKRNASRGMSMQQSPR